MWVIQGGIPFEVAQTRILHSNHIFFCDTEVDWLDIIGILYFIFLNDPDTFFLEYANGLDISLAGYYWNCSLYILI